MSTEKPSNVARNLGDGVRFIRVRRITGYLSALDNFNNGKKAELRDRIKHLNVSSKNK